MTNIVVNCENQHNKKSQYNNIVTALLCNVCAKKLIIYKFLWCLYRNKAKMGMELKNHLALSSGGDIVQICKPLQDFGIHLFNFVRMFKDGSRINLCNKPEWLEYYYQKEFYKIGIFEGIPDLYTSSYSIWPILSGQDIFYDARTHFNIDHGITMIKSYKKYCDFYYFGGYPDNPNIINFYLNNIDLLDRFILYFKDQAAKLITQSNKHKIILPLRDTNIVKHELLQARLQINKLRQQLIHNTCINSYYFEIGNREVKISKNEMKILLLMAKGKSSSEIAEELFRSKRTIENHIYNIKIKLDCNLKSELLNILSQWNYLLDD